MEKRKKRERDGDREKDIQRLRGREKDKEEGKDSKREREGEREGKRGKSQGEEERGLKTFSRELCIELSLTLVAPQEFTAVGVDSIFQPASLRQVHVICHPPYCGHI